MSQKEIDRYEILKKLIAQKITGVVAASLLRRSLRQIWRLRNAVKKNGASALVHGNRGRTSNRALTARERTRIVALLKKKYADFGPTLAAEKLAERHAVVHDPKTIRALMIAAALWKPRTRAKDAVHRIWRERRAHVGELVQFDGSYHHWFEDRGGIGEACLLAAIDDATGRVLRAEFADHEGVLPVFRFWKGYCEERGKPIAIYLDKFSTYRLPERFRHENEDLCTQFERAMRQLRIDLATAHSPQAKGRIERLFETWQERLVKELRLRKIDTVAGANRFLRETFIPKHNERFAVPPRQAEDLHRPLTGTERRDLPSVFSRQTARTIQNDFTVTFRKQWLQIDPTTRVAICPKEKVTVEEQVDDSVHLRLRGKELIYHRLPERPERTGVRVPWVLQRTEVTARTPLVRRSAANHPWRQYAAAGLAKKNAQKVTFLNP